MQRIIKATLISGCFAASLFLCPIANAQVPITIGSYVSTTGTGGPYGIDQLQGIELAIKHVNADGGISGRPLILKQRDAAYDKTQAQSVMKEMIADPSVIGLIGPTSSSEAFASVPAANAAKLAVLGPNLGATGIPQIGPYMHRIGVPEELLLPSLASRAVKMLKLKRVAIFYAQNDPFPVTGFKAFQAQLQTDLIEIVDVVGYDSKSTVDFTAPIERVRQKNPDGIFIAALSSDGAVLLRQIRQAGIKAPIIGNLGFTSPGLVAAAGDAAEGLIVGATYDPLDKGKVNVRFVEDYRAAYKRDPGPLAVPAYNAVYVLKNALERSGEISRAGLQRGLLATDGYEVLGSKIEFKKLGNDLTDAAITKPVLFQYQKGKQIRLDN